ncbi:MAG: metal-dependent hydrolase [Mycobacterium sp.]
MVFKFLLDNEDIMFRPGDDRVASLLLWHTVEGVEHRSSAVVIYNAAVGQRMYRLRILPSVIRHIMGTLVPIYVNGMNTHVPERDRVLDLRVMSVSWRIRVQLRALVSRDHLISPPMLKAVDRKGGRQALRGLVLSQNPYFDPADEAIP